MPPDLFSPPFDYAVVDGLGRARQRGIAPKLDGKVFRARAAGPAIELAHLATGIDLPSLKSQSWFDDGSLGPLLATLATKPSQWLAQDGRLGFVSASGLEQETILTSFKIDAHKAARTAGFGNTAALLVAALGELIGNVIDHSDAPASGIALFSAERGHFEFVVADTGIGALKSLSLNPEHAHLSDDGAALQAMVEAGVSRFGRDTGHGNGFRPIFERLADLTGQLRFRSGDHALTLDGRFGDRIGRQVAQKPRMRGFFAAVNCRAPNA
ncbi:MAG: ATP-binding protein [Pseudomonadota bacterium]